MLRIGRDHRLQSRSGRAAVHCRHIILGIGALLAAVMAAAPSAAALDRVITFAEAQAKGAVFETDHNPNNCIVSFLHDGNPAEISGVVKVDCTSVTSPSSVKVTLFSGMALNRGWSFTEVRLPRSPPGSVIRKPAEGTSDIRTQLEIDVSQGQTIQVPVVLDVTPNRVDKPICPAPTGISKRFKCDTDADCQGGMFCSNACHFCDPTHFNERVASRVLTIGEMRDLGYSTPNYPPFSGRQSDAFRIIWEGPGRCKASLDNGRTPDESLAVVLNCTGFGYRHTAATATFQLFSEGYSPPMVAGIPLNMPWIVESATMSQFVGDTGAASPLNLPETNAITPFTRVRLDVKKGKEARAAVSIRIVPNIEPPLPNCLHTLGAPGFVCTANADCPRDASNALGLCSANCGNRCIVDE